MNCRATAPENQALHYFGVRSSVFKIWSSTLENMPVSGKLDVTRLAPGTYTLKITAATGIYLGKFIKL